MTLLKNFTLIFTLVVSAGTIQSSGQEKTSADPHAFEEQFRTLLQRSADSIIQHQKSSVDSVLGHFDRLVILQSKALRRYVDSLVSAAKDGLDPARKDSANSLGTHLSRQIIIHTAPHRQKITEHDIRHQHVILKLYGKHEKCESCKKKGDFEDALAAFRDDADNTMLFFSDQLLEFADEVQQNIADDALTFRDSIESSVQQWIDNRREELDKIEEHSSKLLFSLDARTPNSYLGRDNGIRQASVNPSIYFQHSSGFFAALGETWMELQSNHWYGTGAGMGYNLSILPSLGAAIGYSGFWFKDSSTQDQYGLSQFLDAQVYYESSVVNITAGISLSTSDGSDMGLAVACSHRWEWGIVSFEPTFSAIWGKQSWDAEDMIITAMQETVPDPKPGNPNKTKIITVYDSSYISTTKTALSIMSYQIDIPINIRIGRGVLTPTISYIIPVNVLEDSNKKSFFAFGLTFMIDWIL